MNFGNNNEQPPKKEEEAMKMMETEHGTFPVVGEDYEISDEEKAKRQAEENFKNLMDGKTVEIKGAVIRDSKINSGENIDIIQGKGKGIETWKKMIENIPEKLSIYLNKLEAGNLEDEEVEDIKNEVNIAEEDLLDFLDSGMTTEKSEAIKNNIKAIREKIAEIKGDKTASTESAENVTESETVEETTVSDNERERAIRSDLEKAEAVKNNIANRVEAVFIRINDGTLDNEDERKRTKKNLERIEKDFDLYKNELKNDGVDIEKLQRDIEEAKKQVEGVENSNNAKEIEYTEEQIVEAEKGALNLNEALIQKEIQNKKESIQGEILAIREAINQAKDSEIKSDAKTKVLAIEGILDNLNTREDIDELDREMEELGEIMDNIIEDSEEGLGDKSAFEGYEFPSDKEEVESEEDSEETETQEPETTEEAVEGEVLELVEIGEELSEKVKDIKEKLRENIGSKTEEGLILERQLDEIQGEIAKLNNQIRSGEKTAAELKDEYDFWIRTINLKKAESDINWGSTERAKANLAEMNIIFDESATAQMSKEDIKMLLLSQVHQRDALGVSRKGMKDLLEETSEIRKESVERLQEAERIAAEEAEENISSPEEPEVEEKKIPFWKRFFKSKKKGEAIEEETTEEGTTNNETSTEELGDESAFTGMEIPDNDNNETEEEIDKIGDESIFEGIINPIEEDATDDETSTEELGDESAFAVEELELPEDNLEETKTEDSTEEMEEKLKISVEYLKNNTDKLAKSLLTEEIAEVSRSKEGLVNVLSKVDEESKVIDLLKEKMGSDAEKFLKEIDPLLDAVQENERLVFKKDIRVKNLVKFIEK